MSAHEKISRRDEAFWQEFLDEFYEGGKQLVTNTNRDTKDKFRKVEVLTLLRTDPKFRKLVKGQFRRWLSQREKAGPAGSPIESLDQLQQGARISWEDQGQTVRGVVEKARGNRAVVRTESGPKIHIRPWDVESMSLRVVASLKAAMVRMARDPDSPQLPRWKLFLRWRFGPQGATTQIQNTNHETRDRWETVEVDTLFKNDEQFRQRLIDEYEKWISEDGGRREEVTPHARHGFRPSEFVKTDQLVSELTALQSASPSLSKNKWIKDVVSRAKADKPIPMRALYHAEHALRSAELGKEKGGKTVGTTRTSLHPLRDAAERALSYERPSVSIDEPKKLMESLAKPARSMKQVHDLVEAVKEGKSLSGDQIDSALEAIETWGRRASDEQVHVATPGALMLLNAKAEGFIKADENERPTDGAGQPRLPKKSKEDLQPKHLRVPEGWDPQSEIIRYADDHVPVYAKHFDKFFKGLDHQLDSEADEYEEDVLEKYPDEETRKAVQAMWNERPSAERKLYVGAQQLGKKFYRDVLSMRERAALSDAVKDWQEHPSNPKAHRLYGLLEGLGVSGGTRARDTGDDAKKHRKEGSSDEPLKRALAKAMAFSKAYFDHLGLQDAHLYRGMRAPSDAKQGDDLKVSGLRELSSLSMSPVTAYTFSIPKTVPKRAVKYRVPVERLFLSPVTIPSLGSAPPWSENEFVAAGLEDIPGKVMPQYISDYDSEIMKIAREHEVWSTDLSEEDDGEWHEHIQEVRKKGPNLEFKQERTASQIDDLPDKRAFFQSLVRRELRTMNAGR